MTQRSFRADVPIDEILCPPQPREYFDESAQTSLNATVKQQGVQVPLLLRQAGGKLYLWDGARRLRAARAAGQIMVPAMIEACDVADADIALTQVLLNAQREDLTPLEKAKAIDAAIQSTGSTAKQVAAKLGTSSASITRLLSLLKLPPPIQDQVATGKIPASSAYRIARVADASEQLRLAEQVAAGLTREGLDAARKAAKRSARPARPRKHTQKLNAKFADGARVTVASRALTVESIIQTLEELLSRVRSAQGNGTTLDTLLQDLKSGA